MGGRTVRSAGAVPSATSSLGPASEGRHGRAGMQGWRVRGDRAGSPGSGHDRVGADDPLRAGEIDRVGPGRHAVDRCTVRGPRRPRSVEGRPDPGIEPSRDRELDLLEERVRRGAGAARAGRAVGGVRVRPDRLVAEGGPCRPDHRGRAAPPRECAVHRRPGPQSGGGPPLRTRHPNRRSGHHRRPADPPRAGRQGRPRAVPPAPVPDLGTEGGRPTVHLGVERIVLALMRHHGGDQGGDHGRSGATVRTGQSHQSAQLHQAPARPGRVRRTPGRPRNRVGIHRGPRPVRRPRNLRVLHTLGRGAPRLPLLLSHPQHGSRTVGVRPPGTPGAHHRGRSRLDPRLVRRLDHPGRRDAHRSTVIRTTSTDPRRRI